jgi:general secretion pathway protein G
MNNLKNSPLQNARGMTLVEILIVLAIVGSLMAVIGGTVMERFQKAKQRETKIIMSQISSALSMYYSDCGKMPQALSALVQSPGDGECADWGPEPYVKKELLKDAWKTDFVYSSDGSNFELKSLGKGGQEGGSKYEKDLPFEEQDSTEK